MGFSQKYLALEANYSPQYLSNIERGDAEPSTELKKKLLKILKIHLADWVEVETRIFQLGLVRSLNARKEAESQA